MASCHHGKLVIRLLCAVDADFPVKLSILPEDSHSSVVPAWPTTQNPCFMSQVGFRAQAEKAMLS